MEILILIAGIVQFIMVITFFQMSSNLAALLREVRAFNKYYYAMQEFKNKDLYNKPAAPSIVNPANDPKYKPIDSKLTMAEFTYIYHNDNNKFMDIANYFYKNDRAFYDANILPIFESNKSDTISDTK